MIPEVDLWSLHTCTHICMCVPMHTYKHMFSTYTHKEKSKHKPTSEWSQVLCERPREPEAHSGFVGWDCCCSLGSPPSSL